MVLNARKMTYGIFFILLISSITVTSFAQQEQQSDSALSRSQFMQIIDRIDKSEENMRNHFDKKFGELDKKIDDLETKFHELDKKVAVLRSDVDKLFTIIIAVAVAVGAHLLIFIGSHIYTYWRNKTNVDANVSSQLATKVASEGRNNTKAEIIRRHLRDKEPSESDVV